MYIRLFTHTHILYYFYICHQRVCPRRVANCPFIHGWAMIFTDSCGLEICIRLNMSMRTEVHSPKKVANSCGTKSLWVTQALLKPRPVFCLYSAWQWHKVLPHPGVGCTWLCAIVGISWKIKVTSDTSAPTITSKVGSLIGLADPSQLAWNHWKERAGTCKDMHYVSLRIYKAGNWGCVDAAEFCWTIFDLSLCVSSPMDSGLQIRQKLNFLGSRWVEALQELDRRYSYWHQIQ